MNFAKAENAGEVLVRLALVAKVGLVFAFAFHKPFVVDEFWQVGNAKYLFGDFYETIWPAKAVGYALFYKIAHLLAWDAVSTMLIARGLVALLGCATLYVVYRLARTLGADHLRALLVLLVLLSFSNFAERIFRTRAEPIALFFAACALLVIVRARSIDAKVLLIAGVLSGCAFLTTQKAIYFNVALGLGIVADALWQRQFGLSVKRGAFLVAGWAIAIVGYSFIFGGADPLPILRSVFFGPQEVALYGHMPYHGSLRIFVLETLKENAPLYLLCLPALAITAVGYAKLSTSERVAIVFSIVIVVLVFAHNQPWPYVFIMALPFLALWLPRLIGLLAQSDLMRRTSYLLLIAGVAMSFVSNLVYFRYSNHHQLEVVARAEGMLQPGDQYFDGLGMVATHREAVRVWLDERGKQIVLAQGEDSEISRGFSGNPPKLVVETYRSTSVDPLIGDALLSGYVDVAPNIMLVGRNLERADTVDFVVPVAGTYCLYDASGAPADGEVLVDGVPTGACVELQRSSVRLELSKGPQSAFLLPQGDYRGLLEPETEDRILFSALYE